MADHISSTLARAVELHKAGQIAQAKELYEGILELEPDHADALHLLGVIYLASEPDRAADLIGKAIEIHPGHAAPLCNYGAALIALKRFEEAVARYNQAIALRPDFAEAHYSRGIALAELRRFEEAVASYDKAIDLKPNYSDAFHNRGIALTDLKRLDEAVQSYEKVLALAPGYPFVAGKLMHVRMEMCNWEAYESHVETMRAGILRDEKVSPSFPLLALYDSPALLRRASEIWMNAKHPPNSVLGPVSGQSKHDKIKIGYFSPDFRVHPVSHLIVEALELHDRNAFEVVGFSFGIDAKDAMRERVEKACDVFIDVREMTDRDVARLSREHGIDIAVDLAGQTTDSRPGIFAHRAAPVQVNYLGFAGTMAADYYDYLIADETIIPQASRTDYSEKIAYLPNCLVSGVHRGVKDRTFSRADLGLPDTGFVFCCFNNNSKITPEIFSAWMRILKRVEGSVLFLYARNGFAETNLRNTATRSGVDPARIIFKPFLPLADHLAALRCVDLFLDTFPYNAATTANDALWAGVPLLTQAGDSYTSRTSASALNAIGLQELITHSVDDYEALAVELATQPDKMNELKKRLMHNKLSSPIFDGQHLSQHLEGLYREMHRRHLEGLTPDHIESST